MRPDDIAMFHSYRAKPTGQSPAEYARAFEPHQRPRKQWPAYLVALAFLVGSFLMLKGA